MTSTNAQTASTRALRTLRRRAAGEHALSDEDVVRMYATEYALTVQATTRLRKRATAESARLAARLAGGPTADR